MFISTVTLKDFRCYRRTETTFIHPGAHDDLPDGALKNVTLLVGVNGSGKTSILRGVALGVLVPVINESGFRPYYLLRVRKPGLSQIKGGVVWVTGVLDQFETAKLAASSADKMAPDRLANRIEITRRNDYDVLSFGPIPGFQSKDDLPLLKTKLTPGGPHAFVYNHAKNKSEFVHISNALNEFYRDFSPSFFMVGYGANRRVEEPRRASLSTSEKDRGRRYLRVSGLFEEGIPLFPMAAWLPQIAKTERYKEVVQLLNRTLPAGTRFTGRFHRDQQPLFSHQRVELPFPALSDGYRSYVGLLGDLLCHLHECCPKGRPLTDMTGVVMVDDIDLHLHPQWQRVVVPKLARALPRLQFILTTHSPLVAGTVHAANVRVLGGNKVHRFSERLHGLSVDQILSSPYFGHTKPRSDESEKKLQELLEGPVDEGDAGPALDFLRELAGEGPVSR